MGNLSSDMFKPKPVEPEVETQEFESKKRSRVVTANQSSKRAKTTPLLGLINDKPHITLIVAKKGSGKSHLLLRFLLDPHAYYKKYDRIVFISPTFKTQYDSLWCALASKNIQVYEELSTSLLEKITRDQNNTDTNVLVISDDEGEAWRHLDPSVLNSFISNSRHLRVSMVYLLQKITQVPTVVRANADCFIVFAACSELELNALYKEVSTVDKQTFLSVVRHVTSEPYAFLCISMQHGKIEFFANCQHRLDMLRIKD